MGVTVLMCTYNAADYLQQAVDSVLSQTFEDWELLITDDNSSDSSVRHILAGIEDPRVKLLFLGTTAAERRESVRYASIFNDRAQDAHEPYLTFLCGDDFYYPDRLERMVSKLDEGHDLVYGAQRLLYEDGEEFGIRHCRGILNHAFELVDLNSVMMTCEAFHKAGGFPTEPTLWRNADAHLWDRLTGTGYRFVPVDDPERPTDAKHYREDSVDARVIRGEEPW